MAWADGPEQEAQSANQALTPDELRRMDGYWRACNYLCAGMIYLRDNSLLREPLRVRLGHPPSTTHAVPELEAANLMKREP